MDRLLVWWSPKTSLDLPEIQEAIVFSTHDRGQSTFVQINHHGIIPLLPIQSQDCLIQGYLLAGQIGGYESDDTQEFTSIISIACPSERAEPLMSMSLQNGGPGADDLTSFVPSVSRSADRIHTAVG
jgi:hypothetical protein